MAEQNDSAHPASIENWRKHPHSAWGFQNVDRLLPTHAIAQGTPAAPLVRAATLDLEAMALRDGRSVWTALSDGFTDGFMVLHRGRVVSESYANGLTSATPHIIFSVSKSITGILAGILAEEGLLDPQAPRPAMCPNCRRLPLAMRRSVSCWT